MGWLQIWTTIRERQQRVGNFSNAVRRFCCRLQCSSNVKKIQLQQNKMTLQKFVNSFLIPKVVPPRCARNGMPSIVWIWIDGFFHSFIWLVVKTFFHWDSNSKIRPKFVRPIFVWLVQMEIHLSLILFLFWGETYDVFVQIHVSFSFYFCLFKYELWFTKNWISEKPIVNIDIMFTVGSIFF